MGIEQEGGKAGSQRFWGVSESGFGVMPKAPSGAGGQERPSVFGTTRSVAEPTPQNLPPSFPSFPASC
jgi:hypothetical protein